VAPSTRPFVGGAGTPADVHDLERVELTDDRSAALLVRVWVENGTETFRARVTAVGMHGSDDRTVATAASTSDVIDAVGKWLEEFLRYGP
jgi:hypothetical protein